MSDYEVSVLAALRKVLRDDETKYDGPFGIPIGKLPKLSLPAAGLIVELSAGTLFDETIDPEQSAARIHAAMTRAWSAGFWEKDKFIKTFADGLGFMKSKPEATLALFAVRDSIDYDIPALVHFFDGASDD